MSTRANFRSKTIWSKPALYISAAAIIGIMPFLYATALSAQSAGSKRPGKMIPPVPSSGTEVMSDRIFKHALLEQFESRTNGPDNELRWDGEAWAGTDMNRLWLKSEGFANTGGVSDGDHELLYDHPIPRMKYFDAQAGVRTDLDSGPARAWAAIGIEGLAPYYFEFAPTLYIRNDGHVAGRITGSYDLLLTQRWIVQPEAELNLYSKDDPARGIGSGFSELDTGVRLRYEISRKFAPYIGFAYNGKYGDTSTYSRRAGESTSNTSFVFGVRAWY